ncbi:unnamed protein product [Linum trigynum]|uniref:Uncharacterized protein n=1 Tax=Linum trigynum TaxID=586398 RepID=A0AAV2DIB6_9ROSI
MDDAGVASRGGESERRWSAGRGLAVAEEHSLAAAVDLGFGSAAAAVRSWDGRSDGWRILGLRLRTMERATGERPSEASCNPRWTRPAWAAGG